MTPRNVFITGGTGYVGRALIPRLLERGHEVRALVRRGSEQRLPQGCDAVIGNALDASTFADNVQPSDTFVQLVGVPHPSPAKAAEFQSIDLASARASVSAAAGAGVTHFVYVSVAQPSPVMKAYQTARAEGEKMISESGLAGYDPSSVVCARPGAPLALCACADVLAVRADPRNARDRVAFGTRDSRRDGCGSGAGG